MSLKSKKGISPLIAAVLLVVVVVSHGAAVMSLVRNYLTEGEKDVTVGQESIKCGRDVSIGLVMVDGNYQICNGTAEDADMAALNILIENTGTIDVLDAQVRVVGKDGIFNNNSVLNTTLETGDTQRINMTYDPEVVGEFRQVKIVPRINLPGIAEHAYCADSGIEVEYVPNNCSTYQ
ncbi:TPA: hypothetical protein HA265_04015 [Candidatus Woesearchaeota archaeon]|nr:hypothetical protein [Candidatus Woesearchaeota archaeon]